MSMKTALTLLALLLGSLISTCSSKETFEPEVLLCRKDCQAQHGKDWAECEKLGVAESLKCENQSLDALKHCRRDCIQSYADELEEEAQRPTENIFIFHEQRFLGLMDAEDGYFEVLQRLENRSDVFQGLRNFRMLFARACPSTMMLPSFRNMDSIAVVVNGNRCFLYSFCPWTLFLFIFIGLPQIKQDAEERGLVLSQRNSLLQNHMVIKLSTISRLEIPWEQGNEFLYTFDATQH